MHIVNPILSCDFYKVGHVFQYPENTVAVYSNFTPRSNKLAPRINGEALKEIVVFGIQSFIKDFLIEDFNTYFFSLNWTDIEKNYKEIVSSSLGDQNFSLKHVKELHSLGYLPITIRALPEGSVVNPQIPILTIESNQGFFWLTNYLETVLSTEVWKPCTVASISFAYKKMFVQYAIDTGSPVDFVQWQGHDFSMRGLSCRQDAAKTGAAHLTSFFGTDTVPAIDYLKQYYNASSSFIGGSVPATEHSVMCAGGKASEKETFLRLITEVYPEGVVSIVSDTWDYWKVLTEIAPSLKNEILNRKENAIGLAKVVFRPDSGDPEKIICGDPSAQPGSPENKGSLEILWENFGGTVNEKGYRVLNPRVGLIYGDSITLDRASSILSNMKKNGFASCNVVFGIGSFTYNYMTRDTFGFAVKATYVEKIENDIVCGEEIFKEPKTDSGTKKSAKGLLCVKKTQDGKLYLKDQSTKDEIETESELKVVFDNGVLKKETSLDEIRELLSKQLSF